MCSLTRGRIARTIVACGAAAVLAAPVAAQGRVSVVAGTVRDTAGAPIAGVQVAIANSPYGVRSDSLGRFRLPTMRSGKLAVRFRRMGFDSTSVPAELGRDTLVTLAVVMTALAQDLPGLTVAAEAERMASLHDFYVRKKSGFGYFITRDEIEARHVTNLSDMMRMIPGARVVPVAGAGRSVVRFGRSSMAGRDCPPQIYLDGVMAKGMEIDDLNPSDIEAIEIYQGASVIPPQFNDRFGTAICGVVVVWTRVPGT